MIAAEASSSGVDATAAGSSKDQEQGPSAALKQLVTRWMGSRWAGSRPKLLVWDFDRTIVGRHTFSEGVEPEEVASHWRDDILDLTMFRSFVETAKKQGIAVGIASYGRQDIILEYMKQIWPEKPPFDTSNVITPEALGLPDGSSWPGGKPQMLDKLCERFCPGIDFSKVENKKHIIFFDDDSENIDEAHHAGYVRSFHVPNGFIQAAIEHIDGGAGTGVKHNPCLIS